MSFRSLRPAAAGLIALAALTFLGCAGEKSPDTEATSAETGLPATTPAPLPSPGGDPRAEYDALQQRLNSLQQQAMADTTIQQAYAALEAMVEGKMAVADPELAEHRDRLTELQGEMGAAQQAGEETKLRELLEEGTALQGILRQTQQETMAREDVQAAMMEFREKILAKMTVIDPEAPKLVERANALGAQLSAAAMGMPGGPAAGGDAAAPGDTTAPGDTGE